MAGYDSHQVGDATEISTVPETVPAPWLLVAIPGTLLVLIALSMSFLGGLIAAGFVYGAMYLLMHSKQATQYRVPARFRVSKAGIEVNGNSIPKDAIHRVIIRNHVLKAAGEVIVVADPNVHKCQCIAVCYLIVWGGREQQAGYHRLFRGITSGWFCFARLRASHLVGEFITSI
jgi:hypothetical protein